MNKKKIIIPIVIILLIICAVIGYKIIDTKKCTYTDDKPVIYIYNTTGKKEVTVGIEKIHGENLKLTYPKAYKNYWTVIADETGKLLVDGKKYNYLYWEDTTTVPFNIDKGFCVRGTDTVEFLESALEDLGLNEYERNDFITYWLPQMVDNKYNLISFNPPEYEKYYALKSNPKSDNTIRVFMVFIKSNEYVDLERQNLSAFNNLERDGLTIVEWGGMNLNKK